MTFMIKLEDVSYRYPGTTEPALSHLTLSVRKGSCVVVTGPSGSGKTTLCMAATGILHHEYANGVEGQIYVDGTDVLSYRDVSEIGARVGVVFDDPDSQLIFTTIEEEILSTLENSGIPRDQVPPRLEKILETTRINHLRDRAPHTLSGGQKQRAAIAVTLAMNTDILVLDEPTSELDPASTELILGILRDLKADGKAIMIIEHKIDPVLPIADELVLLKDGTIKVQGPPGILLDDPVFRPMFLGPERRGKPVMPPVTADNPVAISVRNLYHCYGSVVALDNVSLAIPRGEWVAVVGENGSGKTTLVRHFNGLLQPTSGEVTILGQDTRNAGVHTLSHSAGLVFQNPDTMFFSDSVYEEVAYGSRNRGMNDTETVIQDALDAVHLSHARNQYPRNLSRGERQRLAIACILAMQTPILILDEPTTGLDPWETVELMEVIVSLQRSGHTIVMITHSLEVAELYADRIIRMEKGKITSDYRPLRGTS